MSANAPFSVRVATARAPGAVAVIEVRGAGAIAALQRLAPGRVFAANRVVLARLVDDGEELDEALLVVRDDGVDVCLHGGVAVVERCLRALGGESAPPPPTNWAAVAARRLPFAVSDAGARVLLDQAEGALDRALAALAHAPDAAERARELAALGAASQPFLAPPRVVLAGPVNAGKSTLFNVLAGRERVLASPLPGTTRDVVRELVQDGELVIELVDTAGRRELLSSGIGEPTGAHSSHAGPPATASEHTVVSAKPFDEVAPDGAAIEQAGQRLGARVASAADLVLWCSPADAPAPVPPEFDGLRLVQLATRADLAAAPSAGPTLSATADASAARRVVCRAIRAALRTSERPWEPARAVAFDARLAEHLTRVARGGDEAVRRACAAGEFAPAAVGECASNAAAEPRV